MAPALKILLKSYAKEIGFIFTDKFVMVQIPVKELFQKATGVKTNIGKLFNSNYVVEYKVISDEFYYIIWKNEKMLYVNYSYFYMSEKKECYYPKQLSDNKIAGRKRKPFFFHVFHRDFKAVRDSAYKFIQNKHDGN